MKWVFIIAFIWICLISCKSSGERLKEKLINGRYWDIYFNRANEIVPYCFELSPSGNCYYYSYTGFGSRNSNAVKRRLFPQEDLVLPQTWSLQSDTMITLQGYKRKIIRISGDTLFIQNPISFDKELLIKSPFQ